jgi:hypothetical protein
VVLLAVGITAPVLGQDLVGPAGEAQSKKNVPFESADQGKTPPPALHYGGFVDLGYSLNFNFPEKPFVSQSQYDSKSQ